MDDVISLRSRLNVTARDNEHKQSHELTSRHSPVIKPKELRLLLIGKTGDGKSETANTILGREEFTSGTWPTSVTQNCQFGEVERYGRELVVIDSPGLCDTNFLPEVIQRELIRSVGYATPGFHAIIFVLAAGRFTEECIKVRDLYFNWFGGDVVKHTLILITRGDEIKNRKAYLQDAPKDLREFIESRGHRVMFFNNKASKPELEKQIEELIKEVDHIVDKNKGRYFSNNAFKEASTFELKSNNPVDQGKMKDLQAVGTSEQTKRKTDQCTESDYVNPAYLMHDERDSDGVSSIESSDESDGFLVYKMKPVSDVETKPLEAGAMATSSKDTRHEGIRNRTAYYRSNAKISFDYTHDEELIEYPPLRHRIKKPGLFRKFERFFGRIFEFICSFCCWYKGKPYDE